ncbi:unnamed protein product [Prorocentrum cordatum]|uniref:Acyltransferase n=1 Tax=Prorocentrum cordatum TaxID=2364126 RepID=A0ABN9Q3G5_9DINO|nr:unnamed protein product [Polarella glacialis]
MKRHGVSRDDLENVLAPPVEKKVPESFLFGLRKLFVDEWGYSKAEARVDTHEQTFKVAAPHLLGYYILSFLLEEPLFEALRHGGLRSVRQKTRLLSAEFCVLYYPVIARDRRASRPGGRGPVVWFWAAWLPAAGEELWRHCRQSPECAAHLRPSGGRFLGEAGSPEDAGDKMGQVQSGRGVLRAAVAVLQDIQWRAFRGALPLLLAAAALLAAGVRLATCALRRRGAVPPRANGALVRLVPGLGFLAYVHGAGALFPLALVAAFYLAARATAGTRAGAAAAWLLAVVAIAAKEPQWPLRRMLTFSALAGPRWEFLDGHGYQGEYDWTQSVNLILLRLLSFALDWHAAALAAARPGAAAMLAEKGPQEGPAAALRSRYSLPHALSHALYAPCFLAGPTIGFDDYLDDGASSRRPRHRSRWDGTSRAWPRPSVRWRPASTSTPASRWHEAGRWASRGRSWERQRCS